MSQLKDLTKMYVYIFVMLFVTIAIYFIVSLFFIDFFLLPVAFLLFAIPGIALYRAVAKSEIEMPKDADAVPPPPPPTAYQYTQMPPAYQSSRWGFGQNKYNQQYQPQGQFYGQARGEPPYSSSKLDIPGIKILLPVFLLSIVCGVLSVYAGGPYVVIFPFAFIIAATFPSLMWISYVYHKDAYEPEPRRIILLVLTWGMFSTVPAVIFNTMAGGVYSVLFGAVMGSILVGVASAPFVEEFWKVFGLPSIRKEIDGELDGIIYGVTAGMGFALVENTLYEFTTIFGGNIASDWALVALIRGLGSTVIHAVCSGIMGYGYAKYVHSENKNKMHMVFAYITAFTLHGLWNGSLSVINDELIAFGFIIAYPIMIFMILNHYMKESVNKDVLMFGPKSQYAKAKSENAVARQAAYYAPQPPSPPPPPPPQYGPGWPPPPPPPPPWR